jgi:hypothetical protein
VSATLRVSPGLYHPSVNMVALQGTLRLSCPKCICWQGQVGRGRLAGVTQVTQQDASREVVAEMVAGELTRGGAPSSEWVNT